MAGAFVFVALVVGLAFAAALTRRRWTRARELDRARRFAQLAGTEVLDLASVAWDRALWDRVGREAIEAHAILPIREPSPGTLDVVLANPLDHVRRSAFEEATKRTIASARVATDREIAATLAGHSTAAAPVEPPAACATPARATIEDEDAAPIVKLVNRIIEDAHASGATDVHVEPREDTLVVRYRIDGRLGERMRLPARSADPLVSRLKLMGGGDVLERRLPQDCRIRFKQYSRTALDLELRLATTPTRHGEACVLRLFAPSSIALGLDALGFSPRNLELLRWATKQPLGVIVLAGPSGSGKMTTCFSVVHELTAPERSVLAVGDDFDAHDLPGVTALRPRPDLGLTTASAVGRWRTMDPDAIAVASLDDPETAREAFEASARGHLVVGTLVADDAPGAVRRLIALGVDPYVVGSNLLLVSAQRLCRRLCKSCKVRRAPTESERAALAEGGALDEVFAPSANGCETCARRGSNGYKGRVAIYEVLSINDELRALTRASAGEKALAAAARRNGVKTLREDGLAKVREGATDVAEIAALGSAC